MKLSKLEEIILTALFALIVGVITTKYMEQYSNIILFISILGILLLLGKYIFFKRANTIQKGSKTESIIEKSSEVQSVINSSGVTQIISPPNDTNRLLLQEARYKDCVKRFNNGGSLSVYAAIDTYDDLTNKEKEKFYDRIVSENRASKSGKKPKENKYRNLT